MSKARLDVWVLCFSLASYLTVAFSTATFAASLGELRLVKVEVVAQSEIPARDKFWDEGAIREPLFRITFSTDVDLERLAKEQGYNIDNTTAFCRGSSPDLDRRLRGFPSVLDGNGRVDEFRKGNGDSSVRAPLEYHVYFDLSQGNVHGFYHYDLTHNPQNVCITVNGAKESLFWISDRMESEALVVSEREIVTALSKAGLR